LVRHAVAPCNKEIRIPGGRTGRRSIYPPDNRPLTYKYTHIQIAVKPVEKKIFFQAGALPETLPAPFGSRAPYPGDRPRAPPNALTWRLSIK
jgi:hypothetical protein